MNNKPIYLYGERGILPIQKILCPIDFSEFSQHAIDVARELASYFGAELILLNVISDVPQAPEALSARFDIDGYKKALVSSSRNSLKKIVRRIDDNNDIKVRSVALQGNPSERITREARRQDVDLIVVTSHSRGVKDGIVFGSVAERALQFAPCPVLIIPAYAGEIRDALQVSPVLSADADAVFEDHLEHLTEKLDAVEKNIEERKKGLDNMLRRRFAELERKNEDLQRRMRRLGRSTSEAWQELKTGFADLRAVFERAAAKFRSTGSDLHQER
jgi:nucleotide-binding universal stress UspA family protein